MVITYSELRDSSTRKQEQNICFLVGIQYENDNYFMIKSLKPPVNFT